MNMNSNGRISCRSIETPEFRPHLIDVIKRKVELYMSCKRVDKTKRALIAFQISLFLFPSFYNSQSQYCLFSLDSASREHRSFMPRMNSCLSIFPPAVLIPSTNLPCKAFRFPIRDAAVQYVENVK